MSSCRQCHALWEVLSLSISSENVRGLTICPCLCTFRFREAAQERPRWAWPRWTLTPSDPGPILVLWPCHHCRSFHGPLSLVFRMCSPRLSVRAEPSLGWLLSEEWQRGSLSKCFLKEVGMYLFWAHISVHFNRTIPPNSKSLPSPHCNNKRSLFGSYKWEHSFHLSLPKW